MIDLIRYYLPMENTSDGVITTHQFYDRMYSLGPEQQLCLAVLMQAIEDRDYYWFIRQAACTISFSLCCEALGIDESAARKAILTQISVELPQPHRAQKTRRGVDMEEGEEVFDYTHAYKSCKNKNCSECNHRYWYRTTRKEA